MNAFQIMTEKHAGSAMVAQITIFTFTKAQIRTIDLIWKTPSDKDILLHAVYDDYEKK